MPTYSWPIGEGPWTGSTPRYGHRSEPHTQLADSRRMASVGSMILGFSRSSTRTSPGAYRTAPRMRFSVLWTRSGPCGRGAGPKGPVTGMAAAAGSSRAARWYLEGDHLQPGVHGAEADQAGLRSCSWLDPDALFSPVRS